MNFERKIQNSKIKLKGRKNNNNKVLEKETQKDKENKEKLKPWIKKKREFYKKKVKQRERKGERVQLSNQAFFMPSSLSCEF